MITQLLNILTIAACLQIANPVHISSEMKELERGEAELVFTASIDAGWHVYSTELGNDGPISATFNAVKMEGAELVGKLQARGKEIKQYDKLFDMDVRYFEKAVTFVQKIRFTKPTYDIDCYVEYGACNDRSCLPPSKANLRLSGKSPRPPHMEGQIPPPRPEDGQRPPRPDDGELAPSPDNGQRPPKPEDSNMNPDPVAEAGANTDSTAMGESDLSQLWQPVVNELQHYNGDTGSTEGMSWWIIFLEGLLGGFIALFTPCVWPIIPMTVSFFLKRNKDRAKAIREATTYGLSIVVIYVLLGLAVTLLFGASALNALATNAVFNILFCLLLVVFAASFLGAFELTLPSSWSNKIDEKSGNTTGLLSIFLMAFTLALVSFSCTGPIIGFLLVAVSTQGSIVAPTIGMLGFAIALATAEVGSEVRRLDERHQGDTRLHRTGLCAEVPLCGRSGLRLAHPRS